MAAIGDSRPRHFMVNQPSHGLDYSVDVSRHIHLPRRLEPLHIARWSAASWAPPSSPKGWVGVHTLLGQSMGRGFDLEQQQLLIRAVRAEAALRARVVVLPGSALGFWTPTMERYWRTALEGSEVTVFAGASVVDLAGYDNVMVAVNRDGGSPGYRQRMPVPVSMWQPWLSWLGRSGGARANFFANPIVVVAGARVATLICYEQLLTWPSCSRSFISLM